MRGKLWVKIAAALFVVALVVGIGIATQLFPPKSFSLPRVAVDADLRADGSMRVVEHLTYDFTGSFTYGTRPIPGGAYQVTDVSVSEHGRPLTTVGAPYNLQWFFDATDEQRTFDIAYTVTGAAIVGPDVVELYWKWVGEAHPTIDHVNVVLHVPPGEGKVLAWGHGPLNGVVRVGSDTVRFDASDVPQGTFVEGRVATPASRFPTLTPVDATPRLPAILKQERAWAASANAARREAADTATRERDARNVLQWFAPPLLALLAAIGFLLVWLRWGREPKAPDDIGKYFRDLPDDPPAVVDALMHWGRIRPDAFGATVLDLAQRGYLKVTQATVDRGLLPDRTEYQFTILKAVPGVVPGTVAPPEDDTDEDVDADTDEDVDAEPEGELKAFELATLKQLFSVSSTVTQSELEKYSRANQAESAQRWSTFQSSVTRSLKARGYINGGRALPFLLNIAMVIILGLVAIGALGVRAWVGGGIALAWAAVQLALTPLLRQRSPKGDRRYHEWLGVRNFLHDFSQLADAPAGHLILWERYLVYAVALGVSDELAHGLAARIPPEQSAQFATWYVVGTHGPGYGTIGDFSSSFASSAVSSFTPPSSGGGGGGGFSGGGGGGGGGGGIGAG